MSPTKDDQGPAKPKPEVPRDEDETPSPQPARPGRGTFVALVAVVGGLVFLLIQLLLDLLGVLLRR